MDGWYRGATREPVGFGICIIYKQDPDAGAE